MLALQILGIIALVVCLFLLAGRIAILPYKRPDRFDETHWARCPDGWRLAIHRVRPKNPDPAKAPVICCHGLGANRFNMIFPADWSPAEYLAAQGYDVFVPELRGVGYSEKAGWKGRWTIRFGDFVEQDLPTIIETVRRVTGAEGVHWVGHSMGGMVAYGLCTRPEAQAVKSFCALGSPATFGHLADMRAAAKFKALLRPFPTVHADWLMAPFVPLIGIWSPTFITDNYNPANMDALSIKLCGANLIAPMPTTLLFDFASFVTTDRMIDEAGRDWMDGFEAADRPFFFIAGAGDAIVAPAAVEYAYNHYGAADKKLRVYAKANGDAADYGHGDLVLSENALAEIYPRRRSRGSTHTTERAGVVTGVIVVAAVLLRADPAVCRRGGSAAPLPNRAKLQPDRLGDHRRRLAPGAPSLPAGDAAPGRRAGADRPRLLRLVQGPRPLRPPVGAAFSRRARLRRLDPRPARLRPLGNAHRAWTACAGATPTTTTGRKTSRRRSATSNRSGTGRCTTSATAWAG